MFAMLLIVRPLSVPMERPQPAPGSMPSLSRWNTTPPHAGPQKRRAHQAWEALASGWRALGTRVSRALKRLWPATTAGSADGPASSPRDPRAEPAAIPPRARTAAGIVDDGDRLVVHLEAPGMQRENLDVQVQGDVLTVSAFKRFDRRATQGRWHIVQSACAGFRRDVALPASVQVDRIKACYRDGVLRIELPQSDAARARRIAVQPA